MHIDHVVFVNYWPLSEPLNVANKVHTMKVCQGYRRNGKHVTLFAPIDRISTVTATELYEYYGITDTFMLRLYPTVLRRHDIALRAAWFARRQPNAVLHTLNPAAALYAAAMGVPTIFEVHAAPGARMAQVYLRLLFRQRQLLKVIAITAAVKEHFLQAFPTLLTDDDIMIEPDAVDMQQLRLDSNTGIKLRNQLGYTEKEFIALYAGSLYKGRGIEFLQQLAATLPDIAFFVLGGNPAQIAHYQMQYPNWRMQPAVKNQLVWDYLHMADVLLMPYDHAVYTENQQVRIDQYASPMKMFEYMAARRPIVTSDLPVLREVLNDDNALLCPPGDMVAWQTALTQLQADASLRARLSSTAFRDVQRYTWQARARRILDTLHSIN